MEANVVNLTCYSGTLPAPAPVSTPTVRVTSCETVRVRVTTQTKLHLNIFGIYCKYFCASCSENYGWNPLHFQQI